MLFRSIRSRIVGVVVASLLPCAFLVAVGLWKNYHDDKADAAERVLFHARLISARLDNHIAALDALLAGVAKAVSPLPEDASRNDTVLRQLKSELPSFISHVQVFALDGSNIGTSAEVERRALYAGDRAYFRRIVAGERLAIGDPARGRSNGQWVVSISRPVKDAGGRLLAVIAVGTLLEHLNEALGLDQLPPSSAVQIVNEQGVLIGTRGAGGVKLGETISTVPFARHAADAKDHLYIEPWPDGVKRVTAAIRPNEAPWLISVGLPEDAAFSVMVVNLWWGLALSALALLAAFGLALGVTRQVVKPLRQLDNDAAILAGGDLSHRSAVSGCDEIGALARTLNDMAAALDRWQHETNAAREQAAAEAAERRRAEELERQAKETLGAVIDASPVAIVCSDPERKIVVWSRAAEQIFGFPPAEILGQRTRLVPPEGQAESQALFQQALAGESFHGVELKRLRKDGTLVDVRIAAAPIYDRDGTVSGVAWAYEDITERRRAELQLHRLAHFDQLTGLPNRVSLQKELNRYLADETQVAIALLDLDGFKQVNDTLGHSTGDRLLVEVGLRLQNLGVGDGQVCRLGGDEFVIVISCGDPEAIDEIVGRVLAVLGEPFDVNDHVIHIGGSVGIALAPVDGSSVDELLANADLALYQSKASGGRTRRFFFPVLRAEAQARRELDLELRRAFAQNEFELYFQPQVRLCDEAVVGAEALLRWRHPVHGIVGPGAFIEALSESSIAPAMGKWILRCACEKLAAWRRAGLPLGRIAANLFPLQVNSDTLVEDVEEVLRQTGLPAMALELEITEKAALDQSNAVRSLERVSQTGVQLAFDDFGTGYASLSSLTKYPLARIKIDRSFVANIEKNAEDAAIVRSLIVMAHNLGLAVVAEGVETHQQAEFLQQEGCDEAQGFLFSCPLPADEFERYLGSANLAVDADGIAGRSTPEQNLAGGARMRQR
jgi:diguanylate cyclase (GGDEF)-like protein/PAS domain S-box-containing protein